MHEIYTFQVGNDGNIYAVFMDNAYMDNYEDKFNGCPICCFSGFENAFQIFPNGFGL